MASARRTGLLRWCRTVVCRRALGCEWGVYTSGHGILSEFLGVNVQVWVCLGACPPLFTGCGKATHRTAAAGTALALPAREAHTPPASALHKLARRRPDDRWSHRSSAARRDVGQQGDVGPSGSGAGASQHRAVGGPQHVVRRPERAGLPGWSKVTSAPRAPAGVGREGGARGARLWRAGRSAAGGGDAAASDL